MANVLSELDRADYAIALTRTISMSNVAGMVCDGDGDPPPDPCPPPQLAATGWQWPTGYPVAPS